MKTTSILVVDDQRTWRELLKEIFVDSGYVCDVASSSQEALEKLQGKYFNLAILDIRLVDSDPKNEGGLEVLKWLMENQIDTKVIVYTGYPSDERIRTAYLSEKVIDFLQKREFSGSKILSIIKDAISS